ncbi:RagB/SusD family nutrient uptake outer membrane protein [Chitinophaga sp.]|uniref:RagB/SusD family nutrient uptake outer membrane protein n=1 Tax=Chitinophaga sp. TaxID=1869181 RepID=UPI0031DEF8DC
MKVRKYIIYLLIITAFSSTGCKKYLDQVPDDVLTEDDIFQSKTYTKEYLAQIYANIPDELAQRYNTTNYSGPWTAGSDEAMYNWDFNYGNELNKSTWTSADDDVATYWTNWYKSIRNATDFISKIDGANSTEITDTQKKHWKGEARALRAMYYYWLVRMYGPVPVLSGVISVDAALEDILYARTPFDSCISYIVNQLDSAYTDLPVTPDDNEYGRITQGIAKAYKVEALMLAASPLFNGNTDMASLKNADGTQLVNQSYDANKWKLAADAAKSFIDEFVPGTYSLYTVSDNDPFQAAYLACRNVMTEDWNKEWIFARSNSLNYTQYDRTPKHVGYTSSVQGGGALGATQTMVDAYFMANGLPITNASSGYVSTGFSSFEAPFDVAARSTFNPWTNREPRFYVGITYNNSYWLNQSSSDDEVITELNYSGNSGRSQSTSDVSPTGYILRKNVATNGNARGALMLRLGQIYLDYAEALNEYDATNADILTYLNLIRSRAGIPQYGSGTDPIAVPSGQSNLRTAIRMERRVELAFENVRYFDCHRWKTAMTTDNESVYGMNMYVDGADFYAKTLIETRTFKQRDYLWPIPYDEILKDNKLVQNPGW